MGRNTDGGFSFPESLDLKLFCRTSHADEIRVAARVLFENRDLQSGDWSSRVSSGGTYISLTVKVTFPDRPTLVSVYTALSEIDGVLSVI